jgi:hypothetical protein
VKKLLILAVLLVLASCANKYTYYSDKIDTLDTPTEIVSVATDISTEKYLSSSDRAKLTGELSKHTADLVIGKIKDAAKSRDYNAKEILDEALEYADAVREVVGKEEYRKIMAEYANAISSMMLESILK